MTQDQPPRKRGRPETGQTRMRSFRMGNVYDEAKAVAGSNAALRDVIEAYLRRYVRQNRRQRADPD